MTEIIIAYCAESNHWNEQAQCRVTDQDFLKKFLPGPLLAALLYASWHSISFKVKVAWIERNSYARVGTYTLDLLLTALLFSRYMQTFIQDLGSIIKQTTLITRITESPQLAISEVPAIAGALVALVLQALKPKFKQPLITLMTYFYAVVLTWKLSGDIYLEYKYHTEPDGSSSLPWALIKTLGFGIGILSGAVLTALWNRIIVKEWIKVKQYVPITSVYMLQRQIHDEVREEIKQQIIAELQEDDPLEISVLPNQEPRQLDNAPAFGNRAFLSDNISARLASSLDQLQQNPASTERPRTANERSQALVIAYQQAQPSPVRVDPILNQGEYSNTSWLSRLRADKCVVM